jgi:hypothetical protein
MRHNLPKVSEILLYVVIRILATGTALFYNRPLSSFAKDHGYAQSQITILFLTVGFTLLLIWMALFFLARLVFLRIGLPGIPEVLVYILAHLLPFAMGLSGSTVSLFLWVRDNGISVDQFNIAYPIASFIVVLVVYFGLRQLLFLRTA